MGLHSASVIGAGFYGVVIALYLKQKKSINIVDLYEQELEPLARASFINQARVHRGYHYPRSYTTAYRSQVNFQHFCSDFRNCIVSDFQQVYAIARHNSKVSAHQFERFCERVGAKLEPAEADLYRHFNPRVIESVYRVQEYAFDAIRLRAWLQGELQNTNIDCHYGTKITHASINESRVRIQGCTSSGEQLQREYDVVFNCTYSGLTRIETADVSHRIQLKHEITELALIEPPPALSQLGITVMDGPFFSLMPFPAQGCHSLSHVRYTPHCHWKDADDQSPYAVLAAKFLESRVDRMLRDACRYVPIMTQSRYRESLYEIKTVLEKNEVDDARPILLRESPSTPGFYSVLGGKIDNIYDVLESMNAIPRLCSSWKNSQSIGMA